MDQQAKKDAEEYQRQLEESKKSNVSAEEKKEESADWKTFSNSKFSLKYPNEWTVQENVNSTNGLEGLSVLGGTNVVIKNTKKGIAMAISYGELWGSGGPCTKRNVAYSSKLTQGKLTLVKVSDTIDTGSNLTEYCGNQGLSGYSATVSKIEWKGSSFYPVSGSLEDKVTVEAIDYFEKIMNTVQFK